MVHLENEGLFLLIEKSGDQYKDRKGQKEKLVIDLGVIKIYRKGVKVLMDHT